MNTAPARLGKIARLPLNIRQQLNERLADNQPAEALLAWLHAEPAVQQVLAELFEGHAISQQNLSAWKTGGFRDWERAQEACARARGYLEEAGEVGEETWKNSGDESGSFLDCMANRLALALWELFCEAQEGEKGPARTREMLAIAREMTRLRRGDQQQRQTDLAEQRWEREEHEAEMADLEKEHEMNMKLFHSLSSEAGLRREEYVSGLADGTLTPRRAEAIRGYFTKMERAHREQHISGLPEGAELEEALAEVREELCEKKARKAARHSAVSPDEDSGETSPYKAAQGATRCGNLGEEEVEQGEAE